MIPCLFCGVLPEYGHMHWCKITRAPTGNEIARAVINEHERSVVFDGPSGGLVDMCRAYLGIGRRLERSGGWRDTGSEGYEDTI
jgi:hypothetical protein